MDGLFEINVRYLSFLRKLNNKFNFSTIKTNVHFYLNNLQEQIEIKTNLSTINTQSSTKYEPTDLSKLINITTISEKINILFLRKTKIFNKGRYSRNRQLYRTGVY